MTLRMGIIGLSPGNGHPYSWSAICNGYDSESIKDCSFPVIPQYLARQTWPDDQLIGARVTHVWTQNKTESLKIAKACYIDNVVNTPEDMIGKIDALLLARDDANNHQHFAEPFLQAGLPIYIDKPIALRESQFNKLNSLQMRPGQIFSCSALRFAPELSLSKASKSKLGQIRFIQGSTPKYWETYAIHLIDPVLNLLGFENHPDRLFSENIGDNGRILGLKWPLNGPDVHLLASGSLPCSLKLHIVGENDEITLKFKDTFTAFKLALTEFIGSVNEGHSRLPSEFNRRAVQIIEMGLK